MGSEPKEVMSGEVGAITAGSQSSNSLEGGVPKEGQPGLSVWAWEGEDRPAGEQPVWEPEHGPRREAMQVSLPSLRCVPRMSTPGGGMVSAAEARSA